MRSPRSLREHERRAARVVLEQVRGEIQRCAFEPLCAGHPRRVAQHGVVGRGCSDSAKAPDRCPEFRRRCRCSSRRAPRNRRRASARDWRAMKRRMLLAAHALRRTVARSVCSRESKRRAVGTRCYNAPRIRAVSRRASPQMSRESMEFDVVVVGAGPAGLATACRLAQLARAARPRAFDRRRREGRGRRRAHRLRRRVRARARSTSCFPTGASAARPSRRP